MLFVAEYELNWDALEDAVAKRLEWGEVKPDSFRYVGEYFWHDGDPPFKGVVIMEVETVDDVHSFILHYGPTMRWRIHAATDVLSGIETLERHTARQEG